MYEVIIKQKDAKYDYTQDFIGWFNCIDEFALFIKIFEDHFPYEEVTLKAAKTKQVEEVE